MPYAKVANANEGKFDYASSTVLNRLIIANEITHFYRPSEQRFSKKYSNFHMWSS